MVEESKSYLAFRKEQDEQAAQAKKAAKEAKLKESARDGTNPLSTDHPNAQTSPSSDAESSDGECVMITGETKPKPATPKKKAAKRRRIAQDDDDDESDPLLVKSSSRTSKPSIKVQSPLQDAKTAGLVKSTTSSNKEVSREPTFDVASRGSISDSAQDDWSVDAEPKVLDVDIDVRPPKVHRSASPNLVKQANEMSLDTAPSYSPASSGTEDSESEDGGLMQLIPIPRKEPDYALPSLNDSVPQSTMQPVQSPAHAIAPLLIPQPAQAEAPHSPLASPSDSTASSDAMQVDAKENETFQYTLVVDPTKKASQSDDVVVVSDSQGSTEGYRHIKADFTSYNDASKSQKPKSLPTKRPEFNDVRAKTPGVEVVIPSPRRSQIVQPTDPSTYADSRTATQVIGVFHGSGKPLRAEAKHHPTTEGRRQPADKDGLGTVNDPLDLGDDDDSPAAEGSRVSALSSAAKHKVRDRTVGTSPRSRHRSYNTTKHRSPQRAFGTPSLTLTEAVRDNTHVPHHRSSHRHSDYSSMPHVQFTGTHTKFSD